LDQSRIVNQQDIKELIRQDKIFARIYEQYGAPPGWSREPGFVSLSKIILEQQVSLESAKAHFEKLNGYMAAFSPENILRLTDEEMRACQISRQKAKYLRALSEAIIGEELDLMRLSGFNEPEIRAQLTSIKGIGHWTTDIYLMFCLQAKDIFPIGDIAVVNTVRELWGAAGPRGSAGAMTSEEILLLAEKWKPLRSLAAYFCWHYYLRSRNRV